MEYMHIGLVLVSVLTGALCQIHKGPENTAGLNGARLRLNCSATIGGDILEWSHFLNADGRAERIWINTKPDEVSDARFELLYDVDAGYYDLVIKDLTAELAGRYQCLLFTDDDKVDAEVISLERSICEPEINEPPLPPNPPERPEGALLTYNRKVYYSGAIEPSLIWMDDNGNTPPQNTSKGEDEDGKTFVRATANVNATSHYDGLWFHCDLTFDDISIDFFDTCGSYYEVTHAVSNIATEPDAADFENEIIVLSVGDHINCTASGRPEPSFYWMSDDGAVYDSHRLDITEEMLPNEDGEYREFECHAQNTISGSPRYSNLKINVYAEPSEPDDGESTQTEGWVIAVAVVIPLLLIATIVIVGVFFVLRRNKKNNAGTEKKDMGDMERDNKGYPGSGPIEEPGPPARVAAPPPQGQGSVNYNPQGRVPPAGAVPVMPMTQQGYPGRASPGYADLGQKHIAGSASSLNTSHDSLAVNQFMGDEQPPGTPQGQGHQNATYNSNHHPGYQNAPGQGPPPHNYAPQGQGSDTVV